MKGYSDPLFRLVGKKWLIYISRADVVLHLLPKLSLVLLILSSATMISPKETPLEKTPSVGVNYGSAPNSIEIIEAQGFDEKATKKLIRRIDWHLIPFLSLIYL